VLSTNHEKGLSKLDLAVDLKHDVNLIRAPNGGHGG